MGPQKQVEKRERECQRQIRGWEQGGAEEVGSIFSFSGYKMLVTEKLSLSFSSSSQGKTKFFYKI